MSSYGYEILVKLPDGTGFVAMSGRGEIIKATMPDGRNFLARFSRVLTKGKLDKIVPRWVAQEGLSYSSPIKYQSTIIMHGEIPAEATFLPPYHYEYKGWVRLSDGSHFTVDCNTTPNAAETREMVLRWIKLNPQRISAKKKLATGNKITTLKKQKQTYRP